MFIHLLRGSRLIDTQEIEGKSVRKGDEALVRLQFW